MTTLNDLMTQTTQKEHFLENPEALAKFLPDKEKLQEYVAFLADQVDSKMVETTLMLDNYVTVDGEEITIYEATLWIRYLNGLLDVAANMGVLKEFQQVAQHRLDLITAVTKGKTSITIPEEPTNDE